MNRKSKFRNRAYLHNYRHELPTISETEEFDEEEEIRNQQNEAMCKVGKDIIMSALAGVGAGVTANALESNHKGSLFKGSFIPSMFLVILTIKNGLNSEDEKTRNQYQYVSYAAKETVKNILFKNNNENNIQR